jgi:hypothetical protein
MDIESFKRELTNRMTNFIEWEHSKSPNDVGLRAASLGKFRTELKTTINNLMEERRLMFNHDVELGNFMNELNPPIEDLMNKYISG